MNTIGLVITILTVSICILLAIVVYNNATRWVASVILPLLCVAGYLGWNSAEDLKGKPTKNLYDGDAIFLNSVINMPDDIYVWIQPLDLPEPIAIRLPFSQKLAEKMAKANANMCDGKIQGIRPKDISADETEPSDELADQKAREKSHKAQAFYDFNIKINPVK